MEMSKGYNALSIDYHHEIDSDGGSVSLLDLVGIEEKSYAKVDLQLLLKSLLPVLPEREQQILHHIFFDNMSQQEVGDILGMSQMHASRLQRRALRKLREVLESEIESSYIE